MDATSAISGVTQANSAGPTARNPSTVDYDAFLQLLVTQLQNQDPTQPTDNAELMAQLASFSSVEQQVQTNERLDELIRSNVLGDATNLIGKTVTSPDGSQSGTVKAVLLADNGIFAELEDGSMMAILSGTRIAENGSAPVQTATGGGGQADDSNADNPFGLY